MRESDGAGDGAPTVRAAATAVPGAGSAGELCCAAACVGAPNAMASTAHAAAIPNRTNRDGTNDRIMQGGLIILRAGYSPRYDF